MKKKFICAILIIAFLIGLYFICLDSFNKNNKSNEEMTCSFTYVDNNNNKREARQCSINNYVKTCDGNINIKLYWENCK